MVNCQNFDGDIYNNHMAIGTHSRADTFLRELTSSSLSQSSFLHNKFIIEMIGESVHVQVGHFKTRSLTLLVKEGKYSQKQAQRGSGNNSHLATENY